MQLTIADAALAEAEEARAYYASIRPELGDDFALTLNRAFDLIANGPLLWSPIVRARDAMCSLASRTALSTGSGRTRSS
jgi:hypothetical protein